MKGGDDEGGADSHAITVVEKALEIFSLVSGVIKISTRAGGHVCLSGVFNFIVKCETSLCCSKTCFIILDTVFQIFQ